MKRILVLSLICLSTMPLLTAQKKSDLQAEIQSLRYRLDSIQRLVSDAKNKEKMSLAKAESLEGQVVELQDANATLLKNLNSFAQVSTTNSDNINRTLASLEDKERQLKAINDAIARNDSTTIVVLTNAKQSLGEAANVAVSNGALVISEKLETLFGTETNTSVVESAQSWLAKVAAILNANPMMAVTVEGLSMTGELDLAARQAAAVAKVLQNNYAIEPNRIVALGKDGNFKEGINFKIHPKYDDFYLMVRANMKNGNKN